MKDKHIKEIRENLVHTYYDMKKAGLVTDKVNELLVDNLESAAYNVIENCKKALQ